MADDDDPAALTELMRRQARIREAVGTASDVPNPDGACSFCGRKAHEVDRLLSSGKASICNVCLAMANKTIGE